MAILPVVFYHAGMPTFSGGYVGVDIFFVVSGFLITQIIMRHIDEKDFSIIHFYERRARRIAPALVFVLLVCTGLATYLFLPEDLIRFSRSLISTALFSSNFLFWSETGYFAAPSEFKPLLHTWSLAVEEQFYIVYPVFLLVVCRYWRKGLLPLLWTSFIASLLLSIWGTAHTPGAAFYLAPTRAWELTLGALLALNALPAIQSTISRNIFTLAGLALIGWSVFSFTATTRFPGLAALAPCLGAGLVIYANSGERCALARLLSVKPIVGIGLISYSLYLWHWPLLVFAKYYLVRPLTVSEITLVILFSFTLAFVSWRWVEQPFRKNEGVFERKGLFTAVGISGGFLIAIGLVLHLSEGFPGRFYEPELQLLEQANAHSPGWEMCLNPNGQQVKDGSLCVVGEKTSAPPSFLLWGDSHAHAIMPALAKEATRAGEWGYFAFYVSCPPLLGIENRSKPKSHECASFNEAMAEKARELDVDDVILVALWANYLTGVIQKVDSQGDTLINSQLSFVNGLETTLSVLRTANIRSWVVQQVPRAKHSIPTALAVSRRFGISVDEIEPRFEEHRTKQAYVDDLFKRLAEKGLVRLIDPAKMLCDKKTCRVSVGKQSLYSDDDHLSDFGARWISDIFLPVFENSPR